MAWPETLIAALAAFGSGAAGVAVSLRQTKATLLSDSTLQRDKLKADIDLSREVREHQLLRDAYAPMMSYVEWAKRVNAVRANVVDRRTTAFGEVRPTNVLDAKAEDVDATRAAIDDNGPTELEQKMIDGGPTTVELFRILGLVDVVASRDVLNKFLVVIDSTSKIEEAQIRYEKALLDLPSPLGSDPSPDEVTAAAKQQISSYADAFNASLAFRDAAKQYSAVVNDLLDTAREELDRIRPKIEPRSREAVGQEAQLHGADISRDINRSGHGGTQDTEP